MTINIQLSTESIAQAIRTLEQAKDNLQLGLEETVDILTKEGEWTAKASIGEMAHVDSVAVDNQGPGLFLLHYSSTLTQAFQWSNV